MALQCGENRTADFLPKRARFSIQRFSDNEKITKK